MLSYLPKPYADELLYSIAARYRSHLRLSGFSVSAHLFGGKIRAIVDLPHCLGFFAEASYPLWGMSPQEIIARFTLFPFYTHFIDDKRVMRAKKALISNQGQTAFTMLGVSASTIKVPKFLKYCPICALDDFENFGETYWRRKQQLPGVFVCSIHKILLLNSTARYRPKGSFEFVDASNIPREVGRFTSFEDLRYLDIAKLCENFLEISSRYANVGGLIQDYRRSARDAGYSFGLLDIANKKFEGDFINYYGNNFLSLFQCDFNPKNKYNWLRRFFRESSNGYHPIQHALVTYFLSGKSTVDKVINTFGAGPWECPNPYAIHLEKRPIKNIKIRLRNGVPVASVKCSCGFNFSFRELNSENPNLPIIYTKFGMGLTWANKARELKNTGISRHAIAKKLGIDFKSVESLLSEQPKKNVNTVAKGSTVCDKKNLPLQKHLSYKDVTEIKWSKRDELFSAQIRSAVRECYNESPPKRVSIARLVWAANIPMSIYRNLHRLTKSRDALNLLTENTGTFQERRLRNVAEKAKKEGLPLTHMD